MQEAKTDRLVLGTAQLGFRYGIANRNGRPDATTARAIVREAWNRGIRQFDTAQAYGDSETVLGSVLNDLGIAKEAQVISKLDPGLDPLDKNSLRDAIEKSLGRLHIKALHGLLLHSEEDLGFWEKGLREIMAECVADGLCASVGVSVYQPVKAQQAMNADGLQLIQVPTNYLDRRFLEIGLYEAASKRGKSLYVRSVFLQGLLLMKPEELPSRMMFARPVLEKIASLSDRFEVTRYAMALGYLKQIAPSIHVIFGAETPQQVVDNVAAWQIPLPEDLIPTLQESFSVSDETLLNPSLWPTN